MTLDPYLQPVKRTPAPRHPQITTAAKHKLACFPATVLAFIVDTYDRYLLLRRPGQPGWEVVNGALQAGETVTEALTRELRVQLGEQFQAVYLGVLDTFTFVFDANLPPSIHVCCLLRYQGGDIAPGRAHRGVESRWWEPIEVDSIDLAVPRARWDLLSKAVEQSRYLRDARRDPDEPERDRNRDRDPYRDRDDTDDRDDRWGSR